LKEIRNAPPQIMQPFFVHRGDFVAIELDGAAVGPEKADEHLEEDALARAGGSHDRRGLSAPDLQVQLHEDVLVAETLSDVRELNERLADGGLGLRS
jgi:hypothetical protein